MVAFQVSAAVNSVAPEGVLNLNKPPGITSRAAVDRVLEYLPPGTKAGHAGTLDPLATGVLVVCVGRGTRLIRYVQQMPKEYEATFLLGRRSPTDDVQGEVELLSDPPVPTPEQVQQLLPRFTGTVLQSPPAFSAVKLGGKRAYELARAGKPLRLKPRPVQIYRLEVLEYDYPRLRLRIVCGSGTYVRSLGRDLAQALGTAAVMSELCRRAVGEFRLQRAVSLEELSAQVLRQRLEPLRAAVAHLPSVQLTPQELGRLKHGRPIRRPGFRPGKFVAALDPQGQLAAVLQARGSQLRVQQNFLGS